MPSKKFWRKVVGTVGQAAVAVGGIVLGTVETGLSRGASKGIIHQVPHVIKEIENWKNE